MKLPVRTIVLVAIGALALGIAGCKASREGTKNRFLSAKDRLEALATKNQPLKADIQSKVMEFDAAFKQAEAKAGDEGVKAMVAVVNRMEEYERQLNPQAGSATGGTTPGGKIGATPPPPPGTVPVAPSGSGFGNAPGTIPPTVAPPPSGSGFGTPGPTPIAPTPVAPPPSGSGFGTPGPTPVAPTPVAPPPSGSGFGGK